MRTLPGAIPGKVEAGFPSGIAARNVMIYLVASDAAAALDFYARAFDAEEVTRWVDPESGKVGHAEFRLQDQSFFIADNYAAMERIGVRSPDQLGGTPLTIWLRVDDLEATRDRALEAGATLLVPIETMRDEQGRRCRIQDPAGHVWTLVSRIAMA
jgi:PhnB protein